MGQPRKPPGTPEGGQYTCYTNGDAEVTLPQDLADVLDEMHRVKDDEEVGIRVLVGGNGGVELLMHSEDEPAFSEDDTHVWFRAGEIHRDDGPAVGTPDGTLAWYQNGKLHRDDGPAIRTRDGREFWFQNGVLHRDDGPALLGDGRSESWFQNGKLHREDGPALEANDGSQIWAENGILTSVVLGSNFSEEDDDDMYAGEINPWGAFDSNTNAGYDVPVVQQATPYPDPQTAVSSSYIPGPDEMREAFGDGDVVYVYPQSSNSPFVTVQPPQQYPPAAYPHPAHQQYQTTEQMYQEMHNIRREMRELSDYTRQLECMLQERQHQGGGSSMLRRAGRILGWALSGYLAVWFMFLRS